MTDLVIVSMHEKGFPQADFYAEAADMPTWEFEATGMAPDDFFTLGRGNTIDEAIDQARVRWPDAKIVQAAEDEEEDDTPDGWLSDGSWAPGG